MKSDLLRAERIQHGWSQAQLAEELGVDTRTVRRWERGQAVPFPYYRQKLSILFGKTPEQLGLPSDIDESDATERASSSATQSNSSGTPVPTSFLVDPAIPQTLDSAKTLLGRNSLLQQIKERLLAEDHSTTALYGLPGSGKTALAAALVVDQQVQAHFSNGVLWARLGQKPNVLGQFARWGRLLGITSSQMENINSRQAWGQALKAAIGTRRFLLIIDDAWSAEDALAFQIGSPQCCHLLTTSLSQVATTFAHQEGSILIPQLQETDGLALLARFVPQLIEQDKQGASALVQAVDALPLALTLMGNYLTFQSSIGQHQPLQAALAELEATQQRLLASKLNISEEYSDNLRESMPLSLHAAIILSDQLISPQAPTALSNQADTPRQPSHFSENTALEINQQPIETLRTNLIEDHGLGSASLDPTVDEHAHLQDELSAAQPELIDSLAGHVQARQEAMHSFGDQIFLFRSLWDFRIHMRHRASPQPSKRFLRPPLLIASILLVVAVILVTILPVFHQQPPRNTHVPDNYAPPNYTLTIPTIDPSLQNTALHLQQAFYAVYPQLVNRFALDPAIAPRNVTLTFSSNLPSLAAVSDTTILLKLDWIQQHPNDMGLLTYELTRLLEQYPSGASSWFSNGMANYARYVYGPADDDWFMPDKVQPQDSYKQGGGVTARFLLWLEQYTRRDIVDQLNHALQTRQPFSSAFKTLTHHTVDELWNQFTSYPVITLLPNQVYKTVMSRKPFYQSSMSAQASTTDTFSPSPIPGLNLSNFAMQADMTITSGAGGGFVFRFDATNLTGDRLRISPDGTYDLVNQTGTLASGFSYAIKQGLKQTNQLTIIEQKYTIYLYINKQFITQADDPNFSYGKLGVLALDWGSPTNIRFDHLQIF